MQKVWELLPPLRGGGAPEEEATETETETGVRAEEGGGRKEELKSILEMGGEGRMGYMCSDVFMGAESSELWIDSLVSFSV